MSDTPTFWSKGGSSEVTTGWLVAEVVAESEPVQDYMNHMVGLMAADANIGSTEVWSSAWAVDLTSWTKPTRHLHPQLRFGWAGKRVQVEQRGLYFLLTVTEDIETFCGYWNTPLARVISVPTAFAPALDHWLPHQGFFVPMAIAMVESWERLGDEGVEQIILATARLNLFTRPVPHVVLEPCDDHRGPLALIAVAVSIRPNAPPRTARAFGAPQREAAVQLAA